MNHVTVIRSALSPALCEALVTLHKHAVKWGGSHRSEEAWRRCTIVPFAQPDLLGSADLLAAFQRECKPHLDAYRKQYPTLAFVTRMEQPSVVSYDPLGEQAEHFHEHADAWDVATATRQVSVIAYLNDVASGGETVFPALDVRAKPETGKLLLFPSDFTHAHLALRPASEAKYVAISWLHFGGDAVKLATVPLL